MLIRTKSGLRFFGGVFFISIAIILVFLGILMMGNVSYNENRLPAEMVAFNSLSDNERRLILVSPKDSTVQEVVVDETLSERIGDQFFGKTLYAVTFLHTETAVSGNLIVYLDEEKENVVGKGSVEKME